MSCLGFKNIKVLKGMLNVAWHPTLTQLLAWLMVRYSASKILITCGYEERGRFSVHSVVPLRGFDLRSTLFDDPASIEKDVNDHWIYDPARPEKRVCLYHNVGQGWHFHFQVHDNTSLKIKNDEGL